MVFLNASMNAIVGAAPDLAPPGFIASFSRMHGRQAVVRGHGDEELVIDLAEEILEGGLEPGDLLAYGRESLIAWAKVESRHQETQLYRDLRPELRIDQLGGLDSVFREIVDEVELHLFHQDIVRKYGLRPVKGILLTGPPGVGKTSLIHCLGNHLAEKSGRESRVLLVPPSFHRSIWHGESEKRVRALFGEIRKAAEREEGYVLVVFDDVDHLGSRDALYAVDARILPSFLAEIDSLQAVDRVLLVGATNRPDLLDEALARPGRFSDQVFAIPRPATRRATREILRCYLRPDLPYGSNGNGSGGAAELIEDVLSALYAPQGDLAELGTLRFRDGSSEPLTPRTVMSGALIENATRRAKKASGLRDVRGQRAGVTLVDLLEAFDNQLASAVDRLRPESCRRVLDLPPDKDVVQIEKKRRGSKRKYPYLTRPEA
jgi:proteasome-associated ATPase